jgi:hypothetical protein
MDSGMSVYAVLANSVFNAVSGRASVQITAIMIRFPLSLISRLSATLGKSDHERLMMQYVRKRRMGQQYPAFLISACLRLSSTITPRAIRAVQRARSMKLPSEIWLDMVERSISVSRLSQLLSGREHAKINQT